MEKEKEIKLDKNASPNVTQEEKFRTIKGDLLQYNEDLTPKGYDKPVITLSVAENLQQFQRGIIRLTITKDSTSGEKLKEDYLLHIDGLLSCIYSGYAKNLNVLRKPTLKQRAVKIQSTIINLIDRFSEALTKK